ncbi:hypothetical protein MmiHf6_16320 [Methanimicrococcus hongohii]|uniref:Uncharacterized protein n=1 Tax=Methanimicrococcus hongohii TaxID=3028295 RepID=A0AA96VA77_9EURY|nr:hypothetical protein [Methanimicrococcus sp. Hf6]WNY24301.1 hypothetical protein MmiHf6_16320 [Methanimicrococcus sp. Hf6]
MNFKVCFTLILLVLCGTVFAGCLYTDVFQEFEFRTTNLTAPGDRVVDELQPLWLANVPKGKVFLQHSTSDPDGPFISCLRPWYSPTDRVEFADAVVYASIKEVHPAVWDTVDGKAPDGYMTPTEWTDEDGRTHVKFDTDNRGHILYT